jgi:hypothetical protein
MPPDGDAFVSVPNVRALSDGLALVCQLENGRRIAVPKYEIAARSEVQNPGDVGTLVLGRALAEYLGIAAPPSN